MEVERTDGNHESHQNGIVAEAYRPAVVFACTSAGMSLASAVESFVGRDHASLMTVRGAGVFAVGAVISGVAGFVKTRYIDE
jgi:hypothetical protein